MGRVLRGARQLHTLLSEGEALYSTAKDARTSCFEALAEGHTRVLEEVNADEFVGLSCQVLPGVPGPASSASTTLLPVRQPRLPYASPMPGLDGSFVECLHGRARG